MKRDLDLLRKILLRMEVNHPDQVDTIQWRFSGYEPIIVKEHIKLLIDDGLLEGNVRLYSNGQINTIHPYRLTPKGHSFLADIQDETIWNKTKEKIAKSTGAASLAIVAEVAGAFVRGAIFGDG